MWQPIIDNTSDNTLKGFLNHALKDYSSNLDIASAFFNIEAFEMVRQNLKGVKHFRLLLGKVPEIKTNSTLGELLLSIIKDEIENFDLSKETDTLVKEFMEFLKKENVEVRIFKGFLHGKTYIFEDCVVMGSSNFTAGGLTREGELNTWLQKPHADYIREKWFEKFWEESDDFKEDLIEIIENSRFGSKEYSPYEIYIKTLFEFQKDEILQDDIEREETQINLAEFQEDAVRRVMTRLEKYGGVIVADSVGLGKTYIALKVIENFHLENRKNRTLIVCPAQLRELVWKKELKDKVLPEYIVSQEEIASDDYLRNVERTVGSKLHEIELVVVDESHNFRNPLSKRWEHLFELINEKIAADGKKPKILFLTATPINNSIWDLYWQLMLMFGMNDAAFLKENIPSLQEFFKKAESNPELLNDILNEISIRRTRDYIIKNYPDAYIGDDPNRKIRFPQRVLENIDYELEKTYKGMYSEISNIITEELTMAYYKMLTYKKATDKNEIFELGRMVSIGGIFQTILLKRLESSVGAFKISIKRQLDFLKILKKGLESGKFISKSVFSKIRNHSINLTLEDIEEFLESENTEVEWEEFNKEDYRFNDLINDIEKDIKSFKKILDRVETITPKEDSKLNVLKDKILELSKNGQIVLFAYYADTLNYIFHEIKNDERFRNLRIDAISSSGSTAKSENQRQEIIEKFINGEIDVLFSTDVLSEGQNLQTAKYIINYDLHWNPTRMVQRAGRIDRIGSPHREIYIYNFFPERELEELINLLMILQKKIRSINESYGLDGSILGEEINPKVFGVIRSIKNKDENIFSELENETFAGGEKFYQPLKEFIRENAIKKIESIPYGVHSGIHRGSLRGIFFYYKYADDFHYWYLYDIEKDEIKTNKTEILDFISCESSEPRYIPNFFEMVYDINKKILAKIEEDYKKIYLYGREEGKTLRDIISSPSTKFIKDMLDALHFEIDEHLYEFPGDTHLEEKFQEIERNLPRVKLTKKRTKELRRRWREYRKPGSWEKMLNDLHDFVESKYVKQENERMEEFDKSKLKLITIDFIS